VVQWNHLGRQMGSKLPSLPALVNTTVWGFT